MDLPPPPLIPAAFFCDSTSGGLSIGVLTGFVKSPRSQIAIDHGSMFVRLYGHLQTLVFYRCRRPVLSRLGGGFLPV